MKSLNSKARENEFACLVCGSEQSRYVGQKNHFDLWKCRHCQAIFTCDSAQQEVLQELYDHYYDGAHFEIHPVVTHSLERVVFSFERFRHTSKILDIGFGEGGLLQIAERQGWQGYGTEISPRSLAYGKNQGWIVTENADQDSRFTPQGFDVVTMIELLEHVPNPQQILQAAAGWLRPGGLLYLTTPNARSLNQRWLGLEWSVVCPPEHLVLWTPKGLRHALTNAGFQDLRILTEGLNPYEMLARLRPPKETISRNASAMALNQTMIASPARRALKTGINQVLSALRLGDSLKVYAIRRH